MKEDSKFKCQSCANQQTNIAEDCPGVELNNQSHEVVEKFYYLGGTIGARWGAIDSVITRIRGGWNKFGACLPVKICPCD